MKITHDADTISLHLAYSDHLFDYIHQNTKYFTPKNRSEQTYLKCLGFSPFVVSFQIYILSVEIYMDKFHWSVEPIYAVIILPKDWLWNHFH